MAVRDDFAAGEVLAAADLNDTFAAKADLVSPTFTGTPAAPTAAAGTNTTQIATTAFVQAAGGLSLITSESFSAVSSVNINNCFSSTYENYCLLWAFDASNDFFDVTFRLRASGSDNVTTNYENQKLFVNGAITTASRGAAASSWVPFQTNTGRNAASMTVFTPQKNLSTAILVTSTQNVDGVPPINLNSLHHKANYQADGFSFSVATGTITGTVRIYGYKD